jgi:putative ABC transport system substrate-binding protein
MAADLVSRKVAVLVSTGGSLTAMAAKAATTTVPIVFTLGVDPVKLGLVASLNRPSANITGVNSFVDQMESKRLGLLHQLIPTAELIAVLINPNNPPAADQLRDIQGAARAIDQKIQIFYARSASELDAAFAASVNGGAKAMLVAGDPFFNSQRNKIIAPSRPCWVMRSAMGPASASRRQPSSEPWARTSRISVPIVGRPGRRDRQRQRRRKPCDAIAPRLPA